MGVLFAVLFSTGILYGQSIESFFEDGLSLEKQFKVEEALVQFELAIQSDPNHGEALQHASRMLSNIAGRMQKNQLAKKKELLKKARTYAQKSILLNPNNPEARLAHIITLGLLSEIATNPHEKVVDARLIHGEAVRILEIETTFAEAYFVLGKWQFELSKLNWMELMACRIFFGGFPEEISMKAALNYFEKATEFNQDSILFLYGQASAQHALGENQKAVYTLNRALALPLAEPDDTLRKDRCSTLLKQIIQ